MPGACSYRVLRGDRNRDGSHCLNVLVLGSTVSDSLMRFCSPFQGFILSANIYWTSSLCQTVLGTITIREESDMIPVLQLLVW